MGILNAIRSSYGALRLLAGLTRFINLFCRRFDRAQNRDARDRAALPPGPINGQGLPPVAALPYGAWTMGHNGCEVIAVYNALLALQRPAALPELAAEMERRGLLFNGFGGTSLPAVAAALRGRGVAVDILRRRDRARFDAALAAADCAILSYWTGRTLRRSNGAWNTLHTVAVQLRGETVEVSNCENRCPSPCSAPSVETFLQQVGGEPVCLFALNAVDKPRGTGYNHEHVKRDDGRK